MVPRGGLIKTAIAVLTPSGLRSTAARSKLRRGHNLSNLVRSRILGYEFLKLFGGGSGLGRIMVPRGGIEPPTRGFSIPCSTD